MIENIKNIFICHLLEMNRYDFLFIALLLPIWTIIRLANLQYPFGTEASREYLIGHHIIAYRDFIAFGPSNALGDSFNSALFNYLIALVLVVKDDIFFLGLVNLFLQFLTIVFVYLIAKKLFSSGTALIASTFFTFSFVILQQATRLWQPHAMQAFISLSYLLLVMAYLKRSYPLLLASISVFIVGAAIHPSAYGVFPMFMLMATVILKKQQASIWRYVLLFCVSIGSFLLFYSQNILALVLRSGSLDSKTYFFNALRNLFPSTSLPDFFRIFFHNASALANQFFFHNNQPLISPNFILLFILILSVPLYFFYFQKHKSKKIYLLIILGFIAQMLILGSLLGYPFRFYYFTPLLGLFIISISEIINTVFSRYTIMKSTKVLLVILAVIVFYSPNHRQLVRDTKDISRYISGNTRSFTAAIFPHASNGTGRKPLPFFEERQGIQTVVDVIKKEIFEIQRKENEQDLNFFQIEFYRDPPLDGSYPHNSIFWVLLEKDLNKKFVVVNDTSNRYLKYETINDDKYIFVICYHHTPQRKSCMDMFLSQYQNYSLIKEPYSLSSFSVYVMKKVNE